MFGFALKNIHLARELPSPAPAQKKKKNPAGQERGIKDGTKLPNVND